MDLGRLMSMRKLLYIGGAVIVILIAGYFIARALIRKKVQESLRGSLQGGGAFHDLDVTTLNPSAENLGNIHLESGMLNSLSFQFEMTEEKATGKIVLLHSLLVGIKSSFSLGFLLPG